MPRASHLPVTPTISLELSYNGLEIFVACEQCLRVIVGSHGLVRRAREQGRARLYLRVLSRFAFLAAQNGKLLPRWIRFHSLVPGARIFVLSLFEYTAAYFWQLFKGGLSEISVQAGGRLQGFRIWRNGQRRSWFRYTSQGTVNSLHFICSFFLSSLGGEERDFARGSSPKKKRLIVGYNRRSVI